LVNFRDDGSGETQLGPIRISCDNATGDTATTPAENWEDSKTVSDVEAPTTITCTIDIDP
jgi:hypothetical protein